MTGQFVIQLVKARDLLLILVLQRPWLTEVGLGFIKLLMQAHKALFVVSDKLSDVIAEPVGARLDFTCTIYRSAGASLFGVRVIARILLAAPAISIEPLVR